MPRKINIGVLGCANIAERSIIPAIKENSDHFALIGIASRDKLKAIRFSEKFDTQVFDTYQSLLETNDVDAIYLPLPNALHAEWINNALDRGLHVLVEKSMACSKADVERLTIKAKQKGLVLLENFQFRFHRQMHEIQKIIADKIIGDLRCIRSSFCFPPFPDASNIRYQKALGGGALYDAGAYPIKISQLLMGYDIAISASTLNYDTKTEVDSWGGGFMKQNNGNLFSEITFGFDNYYQCNIELLGSLGKLYTNRIFTAPPGFETEIVLETIKGKKIIPISPDNHFSNMLLHFHTLISNSILAEDEYIQNVNQARLLEEFKIKSKI